MSMSLAITPDRPQAETAISAANTPSELIDSSGLVTHRRYRRVGGVDEPSIDDIAVSIKHMV